MKNVTHTTKQINFNLFKKSISIFWTLVFSIVLILSTNNHLSAQAISFDNLVPTDLTVCGDGSSFTLSFNNATGTNLSDVSLILDFPTGVNYIPSSLTETTGHNVQEQDITDLSFVTFSMNDIPIGASVTFSLEALATFDAYTAQLDGNVFLNSIYLNYNGTTTVEETESYNILYPALSIINVDPMTASVFVGETFTRTVTVVNGGYGSLSTFELEEVDDANLELNDVDIGTFDANTKTVTFSPSDFLAIGNNDGSFDQNESITITQTLTAVGCNNAQSEITAFWGCNNESDFSNTKYPYTTVNLFAPNLTIVPQSNFNTCVDGSPTLQQLVITNNGTGPANELELIISPIREYSVTEIIASSIQYTANGTTTSLNPTNTTPAYNHNCFSNSPPIDGFTVTLPTILPGETITLEWENHTCASQSCGAVSYLGWDYEANYTDMCESQIYELEDRGQEEYNKGFSTFFESPSDLVDEQEGDYIFTISSATFNLPEESSAYFEAVFDIPTGLVWNGGTDDLVFHSNVTSWSASSLNYDSNNGKLTARYDMPLPNSFHLNHSFFDLKLTADCSPGVSTATVGFQLFYVLDATCPDPYRMVMTCYETAETKLHCPGPCSAGMSFQQFEIDRISFGKSDNNLDGLPDATDNLDFSKIKTNRMMLGDTFETVFTGLVKTSATYPSWSYGYASSVVPYGNNIIILSAAVEILDASTGLTLSCGQVSFSQQVSGTNRIVNFDYSPATLAANGCAAFSNFQLEADDEVILTATYKVNENVGSGTEQVTITNEFYLSDDPNGTAFQCNDWNGNFTVIGFFYQSNWAEQYDVKTCTKTLVQNYKMSVGDCCTNYAGGNIFPYEYRNWSHLKDLRVEIPEGYTFVSGSVEQWRTVSTNVTSKETALINPISQNGNTLLFDFEQYLVENGGTINKSDDGYNGKVYIELKPDCQVNQAANNPVNWFFAFQENDFIGGNLTAEYTYAPDYIKYYKSKLRVTTTQATQEGIAPTVSWDIKIRAKSAEATNTWFHLQDLGNSITITEVLDLSTNTTLSPINGFYQIGDYEIDELKKYRITATYDDCDLSTLQVSTGYDCNGNPSSLNDYECGTKELLLYIAPQPSELQVRFNSIINPLDECDNIIGIELEMLSSKLAAVNSLLVDLALPSNEVITIESGSLEVLYPTDGIYTTLPDPVLSNNSYTITGMDMNAIIGTEGLVGVTDVSANIVKLRFNIVLGNDFQPGDIVDLSISGKRPCGDDLPTLALSFDPNASFGSLTGIGLSEASNNWATAWGDYDNDGFVDLFVTSYETAEPNLLYHNNGDRTFTKVSSGAIATDLASSTAASWGDYDNDGDLDLYVANNIGYTNFLYRNNGNGTFVKIQNDPIVNDNGYAHGVSWVDYDNDGFLDMFVTDYFSTKFNQLYHNNGDGTFVKETNAAPVLEANFSVSGAWGDYNNDGYPDLFVANTESNNNSLYENRGDGNFLKINTGAIVTDGGSSVGASWADYDNDGDLDLFVANSGNQNNFLYQNDGDGTFTKITTGVLVNDGGHSHGSAWADYDNDGDLDLFVSNDQGQDNFLYSNNGDGTFTKTVNQITQDSGDSFGASWADIDNDGDVDLFIANHNANENFIYENSRGRCQNKSCITLVGVNTNRSAIGTKVFVKANIYGESIWQMREVSGQTGGGIGGQNELKMIFGLGNASIVDSIIIEWNSGYQQIVTNATINDCITITEEIGSEICGIAYFDANENCIQDSTEAGINNMKIVIQPGNRTVMTDESGAYSIMVEPGDYTISEEATGTNWTPSCTTERSISVTGIGNSFCGNNMANQSLCALPDLKVDLSTTAHRVGFENLIAITYKNEGGQTGTNVHLTVMFGADVIPLESSIPWDLAVGTDRRWNISNVAIGESVTIYVKDSISTDAIIGEDITIKATIYGAEEDCYGIDNIFISEQEAVGAIDPNDIAVSPEGFIDAGEELIYKIRFQNVGNTTVSTVRIEDELPNYFDFSTLQQGVASHPYRLEVTGNKLTWTFENINMPDSLTNEAASHGFIIFKIKTREDLVDQTRIDNKAAIYFDNVSPVITNTVVNIIGSPNDNINEEGTILISPNPMVDYSTIEIIPFEKGNERIQSITVFDMRGMKLYEKSGLDLERLQLDRNRMETGYYMIKAIGMNGDEYVGKLLVE